MLYQALGQDVGHRDCPQLRALWHISLSLRKGAEGGSTVPRLLHGLEVVLGLSLLIAGCELETWREEDSHLRNS